MKMLLIHYQRALQAFPCPASYLTISKPPSITICQAQQYSSKIPPRSSTFKSNPSKQSKFNFKFAEDSNNLTQLSFDAPANLQKQALEMYSQCKLSEQEPTTRFAIVRQMRNLDLPPHQDLWQDINASDELALYKWINEAFGQLLYQKGLWKPSLDWTLEDEEAEATQREENLQLLRRLYEEQILEPLKKRFGDAEVTTLLSNLPKNQKIYNEPAIIWQSINQKTKENSLEWMSEYTADVAWPGLVSCKPSYQLARKYWEAEARKFAELTGGVACGMGNNREMLPCEKENQISPTNSALDHETLDCQYKFASSSYMNKQAAEAFLIKKFIKERNLSIKNSTPK